MQVLVSIDTEEDNWDATRDGITTRNIGAMPGLERQFEALGVRATYFTNYRVLRDPSAAAIMRDIHLGGRSEVATHLHPWNTPPYVDGEDTMLSNLPQSAQAAKIATVTEGLEALLGTRPRSFRAGRFGLGPAGVRALIQAGYTVDSSVTPFVSWSHYDRGPNHAGAPLHPYRLSGNGDVRIPDDGPLLEMPLSSGYHRWGPPMWTRLQAAINSSLGRRLRFASFATRLDIAQHTFLSPEAYDVRKMGMLARILLGLGLPFLHIFWHSPSMMPGLSPFSRTARDVTRLMARFEELLELIAGEASLRFLTLSEAAAEFPMPQPNSLVLCD